MHKFYVVVTAQDGTPNVYMIQTTRRSNDSSLKSIKVDDVELFGEFVLGKLVLDDVLYDVETIDIIGTATSLKAIVTGNGLKNLQVGLNSFEVYATSELGDQGFVYTIEITRGLPSSDASLSGLVIKDNQTGEPIEFLPTFDPNTQKYTVALSLTDQVSEILIEALASSPYAKTVDGQGVYTLKAASSQTTEIFTIDVEAEDGTIKTYEIHVTRDIEPEDDITIDHLSLFGGTINYLGTTQEAVQAFTMAEKTYNILVPYQLVSVNLSITNLNGASIIGAGNHILNQGITVLEFYLVSKSGLVRSETYQVTITKQLPSSDNTLKNLEVDEQLIDGFDPNTLNYQLEVSYEDVSKILVSAQANHPYATVIGDLGEVNLVAGTNTINVRVIAEDGTMATYQIVVSRLSSDNVLRDLFVVGKTLNYVFSPDRIRYEVTVPYTLEFVQIGAVAHEKARLVNTGIKYLEVGDNVYEVYAIAENGLKGKTYEVHVIRQEVSNDSSLGSLVIRDAVTNEVLPFAPEFRPSTLEYIIVLDKESPITSLLIEGLANDEFASVGGNGYKVLKAKVDGDYHNIFEVTVRAQDLTTTTYTISVYKDVDLSDSVSISSLSLIGSNGINYLGTVDARIMFVPNTYLYEITVPFDVTSMTLDIRTDSATPYGIGTKTFADDEIVFEAYLVSQSGIIQTNDYVIRITREEAVVENTLESILLNGETIDGFDPDKTYYELNIPYLSVNDLVISGTPEDPTARVSGDIGTHELEEGKNVYTITVTAQKW